MRPPVSAVLAVVTLTACALPAVDGSTSAPSTATVLSPDTGTGRLERVDGTARVVPDDAGPPAATAAPAPESVGAPSLLPVGPLPADLTRSVVGPPVPGHDGHQHDEAGGEVTDADIAAAWVLARHLTRSDEPSGRREIALGALSGDPALVAAVDAAAARADPASGGSTWAIVTSVVEVGDGWWTVTYTVKAAGAGHVGPTSTPATIDVLVAEGTVMGERS